MLWRHAMKGGDRAIGNGIGGLSRCQELAVSRWKRTNFVDSLVADRL